MREYFGFSYTSPDGYSGKIRFEITEKIPWKNGETCYIIRASEVFNDYMPPTWIYMFRGFYNKYKDVFTLYPNKRLNPSFLDFPFTRFSISPVFVTDLTVRPIMDELLPGDDIGAYFDGSPPSVFRR